MMRRVWIAGFLLVTALVLAACGQSPEGLNNAGNEAYDIQDYQGALTAYHQAQEEAPELAEPHYNAASVHYNGEDYETAQHEIEQALVTEEGAAELDQNSFYNLGNTFFQAQQYEAAIEAYKEALRLRPDDIEAKQNLELALRQLQQQQQEQEEEQEQEQEDQQQEEQQQEDQQQEEQQQEEQQQEEQQQEEQQQEDQQQQDQQQDQQESQDREGPQDRDRQEAQQDGQPQQVDGLSQEQARQLLEAAAQDTESLEEYLQQVLVVPGPPPLQDW